MVRSLGLIGVVTSLLLGHAGVAPAARALDGAQTQTLNTADSGLKQIETNLKLSQDAAGPGDTALTGSKARLVQSRLGMATAPVPQVAELIASLPAKDAQVAALKKRLTAANAGIAAVEARLGIKPAPAATAAPTTATATPDKTAAAASSEPRLDYKQEQLAKDSRSYLDEMEGLAGGVEDFVKKSKPVKDQMSVDHRNVLSAVNSIAKGRQRAGWVKERLDQLPAKAQGVAELAARHKAAVASFDGSDRYIAPLHAKLTTLVSPASYPELEADFKRIQQLAGEYRDTDRLQRLDERATSLITQLAPAQAEAARFAKKYAALVTQQTPDGERIQKISEFFKESEGAFSQAIAKLKKSLPGTLKEDLAAIDKMADEAVKEQKMAFFSNGIPDAVARVETKLLVLAALDADKAKATKTAIEKTKERLKAREIELRDTIIAQNEVPPNRYSGKDRAKLEKIATTEWKEIEPKAQVLAIRIPSEKWERDAYLRFENGSWHVVDKSRVQVQLLVKQDDKVAVIRPIDLWMDHMSSDKINPIAMDDIKDALMPHRLLMLSKLK